MITNDKRLLALVRQHTEYRGNQVNIKIFTNPISLESYWYEGSRDYYYLVNLITGDQLEVPQNGSGFERIPKLELKALPVNVILIEHSYRGTRQYCTIYCREENMPSNLLAEPINLTDLEHKALKTIRSYKNTYGGEKDIRRRQMGLDEKSWYQLLNGLRIKGLVDSRGALTIKGKNAT